MALTLALAGSASATSAVDLVWKDPSTGTLIGTTVGSTSAAPPPVISAAVILRGDTVGIGGVFTTLVYDYLEADPINNPGVFTADGNELDVQTPAFVENAGPAARVGMGNQFSPVVPGVGTVTESNGTVHGRALGFDSAAGTSTGCISCTITLGSILFTTTANTSGDGNPDARLTVLSNGIDGMVTAFGGSAGGALTTDVTFGTINVLPEPMAGLFGAAALGALGLLARRRI